MAVLALGVPRSGTDSLRSALLTLGCVRIWHGFEFPATRLDESRAWVALLEAKARDDALALANFQDWDAIVGDCDALMDMPPAIFWRELLDFYPDASVVVNRRRDMGAWHASLSEAARQALGGPSGWVLWASSWFDGQLYYWYRAVAVLCMGTILGDGDFQRNGQEWGERHYALLEEKLKTDGRHYLDWEVKDGWEPLCKYLGKEVPEEEFPWQNRSGDEFKKNADKAVGKILLKGVTKMVITFIGVGAAGVWLYRHWASGS